MRVLLLDNIHEFAKNILEKKGYQVELIKTGIKEEVLLRKVKNVNIIGLRSKTKITKKVLDNAPDLIAIGCFCIGTNQVDLEECRKRGIPVFNSPYANTRSVAELAISEIIMLSRHLGDLNNQIHKNVWYKSVSDSYEIRGKTLGIIGYGHVGSQLSVIAESLGMNVIYYDIIPVLSLGNAISCYTMDDVLRGSDFVSVHVPLMENTRNLITDRELSIMKKGSYFLNLSRGKILKIEDLVKRLQNGHLSGAALDVYPEEPIKNGEWDNYQELKSCKNVILTPHIGGSTQEAQSNIAVEAINKLVQFYKNGTTISSVNFPKLGISNSRYVLSNIHRNTSGVLSSIVELIKANDLNIEEQYLSTLEDVGYCLIKIGINDERDIDKIKEIYKKVSSFENSIKTRLLN